MTGLLTFLRKALGAFEPGATTDEQLLARFADRHEETAFEGLLQRYGPMVLGVCRRLLPNPCDAEDAFQATFLVLARKAGSLRQRELVGPWLHGVALRVARKARANLARQHAHEKPASVMPSAEPAYEMAWQELSPLLDEMLAQLPRKYRLPLMLCCLQGMTKEEAAQELGWPEGTVSGRLARAREMLRTRWERRGLTVPAALIASLLASDVLSAAVPAALTASTIRTAVAFSMSTAALEGLSSSSAVLLAKGALRSMFLQHIRTTLLVLLALALASVGGMAAYHHLTRKPPDLLTQESKGDREDQGPAAPEVQAKGDLKLFVAGPGVSKPGAYSVKGQVTYREVLQTAGVDLDKVRAQGQVAYLIFLIPESGTPVGITKELTQMLNKGNETMTANEFADPKRLPPHLTLWVGSAAHWDLLEKSTRRAKVIVGPNAEQEAAALRKQGIPAKGVTAPEQGQWPPQYDELMALAEKAQQLKKWPGGESWLVSADDDASARKVVKDYVEACAKGDEATGARLYPGRSPEGLKSRMAEVKRIVGEGVALGEARFVEVAQDRAMVVSDFFSYQDGSRPKRMVCFIFDLRREKDTWIIRDVDVKDVEGLINEVRRFDQRVRPKN